MTHQSSTRPLSGLQTIHKMSEIDLKTSRIGVLMGGLSREREISLRSGAGCLSALTALGYDAVGVDVGRDVSEKLRAAGVEVAFLALHGKFGEDGIIQGVLEMMGIPYTGSGVAASAIGMNKVLTKQVASWYGIPTPVFAELSGDGRELEDAITAARDRLRFPVMVKPCEEGSSVGVVKIDDAAGFGQAITEACGDFQRVLAEEFVTGDEVTVGLLEIESGLQALPVLQLKPKAEFYDFHAKYNHGMTDFILPAELPEAVTSLCQQRAQAVHRALGCRGYSRVDFIVDGAGEPWLTEINTLPGMTETSDLPAQAGAAGIGYEELVELLLRSALF